MNSGWPLRLVALAVLAALTVAVPGLADTGTVTIVTAALFYAFLATCWNITGAYGGKLSLGHSLFVGTGAYTSTVLFIQFGLTPWLGMLGGAVLSSGLGAVMGWLASRYRLEGIFFAIVTLALALLAVQVVSNVAPLGGAQGLLLPLRGESAAAYQFRGTAPFTVIAGCLTAAVLAYTWWLRNRRVGSWIAAVGLNERAAQACGVSPVRVSALGLAIGGGFSALGGTFYAQQNLFVDPPSTLDWTLALAILLPAVIGGRARPEGPLFGALLLIPLEELLRQYADPGVAGMLRGLVLILVVLLLPGGLLPPIERGIRRLVTRARRTEERADAAA